MLIEISLKCAHQLSGMTIESLSQSLFHWNCRAMLDECISKLSYFGIYELDICTKPPASFPVTCRISGRQIPVGSAFLFEADHEATGAGVIQAVCIHTGLLVIRY